MERSKFLSLNTRDFLKGLFVAVLTAVFVFLQTVVVDPELMNWKSVMIKCGWTALAAALGYLVKNLFTNSTGEILTSEK